MRRSICYTEPKSVLAGQTGNWKFIYSPANNLPKGAKLLFDPLSRGKEIEWELPTANLKSKANNIWLELPNKKNVTAKVIEKTRPLTTQFEFTLPSEIKAGENLAICLGTPVEKNATEKGNRSQHFSKRRRTFHLYVDPKGKGDYKEPEIFNIDVRGNKLHTIRIIAPSFVVKNDRFDVVVRFEDEFGNLTGLAPEGTLIELTYEQLRENLNWKLFVPETGFIALPNLYFNEPGLYRLQLNNTATAESFYSPPIICTEEAEGSIYWGLFHGESPRFDACEQIESCLRSFRDDNAMQFYGVSPFESEEEISSDNWKYVAGQVHEFNEDDRFSAFLGFQWQGSSPDEGLKHLIYHKDNKPLLRKKDSKSNQIKKIYKSHTPKELQGIPAFTMAKGCHFDFSTFDPEHEHVVEIYNAWGSSECSEKEGNPKPIKTLSKSSKKGFNETPEGSIRKALNNNHRFGFVAGGLDDRGIYDNLFDNTDQVQYTPGLTAVIAASHTRDGILQALQNRCCFATTGERMIADLRLAGKPMGSEISTKSKPGLAYNRYLSGRVAGTKKITEVIIVRNGSILKSFQPKEPYFSFDLDDNEPIENIALPSSDDRPSFVYYYLRAMQEDGHIIWCSPIWVDMILPNESTAPTPKRGKKTKK